MTKGLAHKSRKRKGTRLELKTIQRLEDKGYKCTRAAGSLGDWDLIAINADYVLLIQVKANKPPSKKEMKKLGHYKVPPIIVYKEIWVWQDYTRKPEIITISPGSWQ